MALLAGDVRADRIGQEFIPPQHWGYTAIDRFEALGFVRLPSEGILTRGDFIGFAETIERNVEAWGGELAGRDRYNLDRLRSEFIDDQSLADPKTRFDPPVLFFHEKPLVLAWK